MIPEGPFAYPYYHENGMELRRWLAGRKIFVPTYWKNMFEQCSEDSLEYQWAANILPLPCDQRYGEEEMSTWQQGSENGRHPQNEPQIIDSGNAWGICTARTESKTKRILYDRL